MPLAKPLDETFEYNPDTGVVSWRIDYGRMKAGMEAGTIIPGGYRNIRWNGSSILAHRIAWKLTTGQWPSYPVRHVNGDPSDNRWENLEVRKPLRTLDPITRKTIARQRNQALAHGTTRMYRSNNVPYFHSAVLIDGKSVFLGNYPSREAAEVAFFNSAPPGTTICPYAE